MIEFMGYIFDFLDTVLGYEIINGVSIFALLFYSTLLIWTSLTLMKR